MGFDITAWLKNAAWVAELKETILSLGVSIKSLQDNVNLQSFDFKLMDQKIDALMGVVSEQKARISRLEDSLERLRDRSDQRTDMLFLKEMENSHSRAERAVIIDQAASMLKGPSQNDG